jgi:phasin family protein
LPIQKSKDTNGFSQIFPQFSMPGIPVDQLASVSRRNIEALTTVAQVAADSFQAVLRRQVEIFTQSAAEGSSGLQHLWSPGAPEEKLAQHADFVKSSFEKGLANFREVSEILVKSSAEASDVLAKRVTESLAEMTVSSPKA